MTYARFGSTNSVVICITWNTLFPNDGTFISTYEFYVHSIHKLSPVNILVLRFIAETCSVPLDQFIAESTFTKNQLSIAIRIRKYDIIATVPILIHNLTFVFLEPCI